MALPGAQPHHRRLGGRDRRRRGAREVGRAAPVVEPNDVASAVGLEGERPRRELRLSEEAIRLCEMLCDRSVSADELIALSGFAPDLVAAALVELELAGEAVCSDGIYRRLA